MEWREGVRACAIVGRCSEPVLLTPSRPRGPGGGEAVRVLLGMRTGCAGQQSGRTPWIAWISCNPCEVLFKLLNKLKNIGLRIVLISH